MKKYYINENNSGGSWWLSHRDYERLFEAGWKVDEAEMESKREYERENVRKYGSSFGGPDKPWGGERDTVPYGWRHDVVYFEAATIREAVESFEAATGQDFFAEGCNCCGVPFSMSAEGGGEYISGSDAIRTSRAPW